MIQVNSKRFRWILGVVFLPVAALALLLALGDAVTVGQEDVAPVEPVALSLSAKQPEDTQNSVASHAYVFRFDPALESFETFTVPTGGARPHSVAVVSDATHLDVWFTEPGVDQIGRLVYTATGDFSFYEYNVTPGSHPLNLVADESRGGIWFTEQQGNRIGRLEPGLGTTMIYTAFDVDTPNSQPSGIDLASDGGVWFTEMAVDQIGHLVVTTTSDYQLDEFPIPQFSGLPDESAPYGIFVQNDDRIWFAEAARNQLVRLTPSMLPFTSTDAFVNTGPVQGEGYPYNLTYSSTGDRLWFTELQGNNLTLFFVSTFGIGLQYSVPTTNSQPYDLIADSAGRVWFSEQLGGKLGRLVVTTTGSFEEYAVPLADARPQGVAVDPHDKIWLVASSWHNVYLPVVFRDYPPPIPPFGIQTYWSVDNAHGLSEMDNAGTEWLRLPIQWSHVEPADTTPANYNWTQYDAWFSNLQAASIRPVVNLHGNPTWAAQYGAGPIYPEHMDDFLEFVGALVERYDGDGIDDAPGSPVVTHWEFYNEIDNASVILAEAGYGYWGHNGAGYADLLRQAWSVIKAANPKAQVLLGGLAYERFEETEGGPYVRQFLDDFLVAGGGQYIDILNFHYYPNWEARWNPYGKGVIGKATYLKSKLASYGVSKPVACTEIGTHNDPSRGGNDESQSRYVVQAFARSMAADLQIVNWFALRDITEGFPYLYGLLDDDYNPKPAYTAFSTLTAQLSGWRYRRTLGAAETGTTAVEGYAFSRGTQFTYVVWTNDGANYLIAVPASTVERVDKYGVSETLVDSGDGTTDGVVSASVGPSPVYLVFEP